MQDICSLFNGVEDPAAIPAHSELVRFCPGVLPAALVRPSVSGRRNRHGVMGWPCGAGGPRRRRGSGFGADVFDGGVIQRLIGDPGDSPALTFRIDLGHVKIDRGLIARGIIHLRARAIFGS